MLYILAIPEYICKVSKVPNIQASKSMMMNLEYMNWNWDEIKAAKLKLFNYFCDENFKELVYGWFFIKNFRLLINFS
jgi:hypothetical protein